MVRKKSVPGVRLVRSSGMLRRGSLRRTLPGLVVLGAWALGVVVLPAAHLAFHALPHDHAGGGIHFHLAASSAPSGPERHVHPHKPEDAAALRRASGRTLAAPLSAGLEIHAAAGFDAHDADGLAHFGAAPGEGAAPSVALAASRACFPNCDSLPERFAEFFLEGTRAPRPPPAA